MRQRLLKKLKQNKAFTLIEMMIVVVIIITLLTISVLAITDWQKTIKMAELDAYAKSVYLEAQNQMAAMEAEGSLPRLHYNFADEDGDYYSEYKHRKLSTTPADYNLEVFGDFYKGIYYFTNADGVTSMFVPAISSSSEYGNYLIEVSLETGDVYGVFFWETDNDYLEGDTDIEVDTEADADVDVETDAESEAAPMTYSDQVYAKIKAMKVKDDTNNRSLESRKEYEIGYYGGTGGDTLSTSPYKLNQEVKIVNGEELYIEISYDLNDVTIGQAGQITDRFDIEITIKGETSKAEWVPEFSLDDNIVEDLINDRLITGFLLDGTAVGQSFQEITAKAALNGEIKDGKEFIPGENLEISVKTIYQHGGILLKEQSTVYRTNSLFHDVTDRTKDDGFTQVLERTIGVSSVRHLKNLGEAYYNGDIVTKVGEEEIASYVIVQKDDIDLGKATTSFVTDLEGKHNYVSAKKSTVTSIEPIENKEIFFKGTKKVKVDGNDFVIRNLKVVSTITSSQVADDADGGSAAGLFKRTFNVDFYNVKLEDYTLSAPTNSTYTGALVGLAKGGTIEKSGVYLAPSYRDSFGIKQYYSQKSDSTYGNEMMKHYNTMTVSGGNVVGGLVGKADKTFITDSYSAVKVFGANTVGGFAGHIQGTVGTGHIMQSIDTQAEVDQLVSVKNSYASGDVYATGNTAGGFVGYIKDLCIYKAYATGDVYAANTIAGFVANTQHSYSKNAYAYGEVFTKDGSDEFTNLSAGGFLATGANSHADVNENGYLSQVGYNASESLDDAKSGLKKEYKDFTSLVTNSSAASSHPYESTLLFKAFPFPMVTDQHYGDWPIQYFINTSLVYYEKYADGSYGYYSVTKLTDVSSNDADANKYVWVLDSLRDDKECREDGYALLTMFYLDSVDYEVYQYANNDWNLAQKSQTDTTKIKGTLKATENEYGSDKMVRLVQQGALVFNAYEEVDKPYSANYDGKPIKSSFITNGMYLYQLPYELQNTYRYHVDNFYDVIVFDEGYAVGNLKAEEPGEVGGTPVISNEVYYYSPHFAKLAINPGLGVSSSTTDFVELAQPSEVSIRTARHLNNLGRVPYYWNNRGRANSNLPYEVITYNQEMDINFGTYARWKDKDGKDLPPTYCGRTYNLLAFSSKENPVEYANQPIGQNAQLSDGYGAFQNDYNGNYHKIIDYCVKSENQYVGLFGEIYKDGGATKAQISNVVMEVSNTSHVPTYVKDNYKMNVTDVALQNNAGLIIGSYTDTSSVSNANRPRVGVGALVGSDYTLGVTDGEAKIFTIYNCASTGYKVEYLLKAESNGRIPLGVAMGGMVGYTRGNLAMSSADNDVKLVARQNMTGDEAAVLLGGFTGSCYYGTTLNCYSGGTIDVDDVDQNDTRYYVNRLRIGGFCPGWLDAPGVQNKTNKEVIRYQNVYSYTEVSSNVWDVREDPETTVCFNHFFPTVSRMRLVYETRLLDGTKWHTESQNGSETGVRVPGFSYYYETKTYAQAVMNHVSSKAKEYFTYNGGNEPKTADPATFFQLTQFNWLAENSSSGNKVSFITTQWYPSLQKANNGYPFPAFVTNAQGEYTHYGRYPEGETDPMNNATLINGVGFEIGYDSDGLFSNPDTDSCDFYLLSDGTYYAEFSFTSSQVSEGWLENKNLYARLPIAGYTDDRGRQLYLIFNSDGTAKMENSSSLQQLADSVNADTIYSLYIYGVDLSKPYNQQNITWELIKK